MTFNSLDFAIFLPVVFILYWFVFQKKLFLQNFLIVSASYVFYGMWNWKFLALIIASTIIDFVVAIQLQKSRSKQQRKFLLWISLIANLGSLGFFKYYNFLVDNFISAFTFFGHELSANTLEIILPVGISFYTFQTLSYTIDVYRENIKATKNFISFAAFVSFFPQLVAGPIERATNLLPQFQNKRHFNYQKATDGLRQILWGLFKKIVIADNCAEHVNQIFDNYQKYPASTLLFGAFLFAFQIYGDFSGYSDIAIGTSRLFGFNLKNNFEFPYFSRDVAEFWRRWHISLTSWFKDYVYIPLGGSKGNKLFQIRNVLVIFLLSGIWHKSNWTLVAWGLVNAIFFIPLLLSKSNRNNIAIVDAQSLFPTLKDFLKIIGTFTLITLTWVFFRAENISHAFDYLARLFSKDIFSMPYVLDENTGNQFFPKIIFILICFLISIEWISRTKNHALQSLGIKWPKVIRYSFYYALIIVIALLGGKEQAFIYFQF